MTATRRSAAEVAERRTLFNDADMGGPMVYRADTQRVVVLVPGDALRAN